MTGTGATLAGQANRCCVGFCLATNQHAQGHSAIGFWSDWTYSYGPPYESEPSFITPPCRSLPKEEILWIWIPASSRIYRNTTQSTNENVGIALFGSFFTPKLQVTKGEMLSSTPLPKDARV
jgi:hypothetical protein